MKKFLLMVAVAATAVLADSQLASARRGGCGGGRHGGCGGGYGGGCGMMMGGCGMGGCGMGYGGGYGMGYGGGYVLATGTEATLVVTLPEDATLTIDGEETASTSANRVFISPTLEEGKEYEYTLQAKVVRDGQTQIATTKVTVRAGKVTPVELKLPAAGVAAQ